MFIKIYRMGVKYREKPPEYKLGDTNTINKDMVLDIHISPEGLFVANKKKGEIIDIRFIKELSEYTDDGLIVEALSQFSSYYLG